MKPDVMGLLPDMVLFVAVARARNFSKAARALAMPVSTVSRRVAELESRLGLQLLGRTTRQVILTEAGAIYFERCVAIVDAAEAAHADLSRHVTEARGHLRISATPDFASAFLTPLFADFASRHRALTFEFDLSPRAVDLVAEGFDVAIRLGPLVDSQLTVRTLGTAAQGLFAAPSYLTGAGTPREPAELATHECILVVNRVEPAPTWRLVRGERRVDVPVRGRFTGNNVRLALQLASLGSGIAMLDAAMAQLEVDRGALVRVLPAWSPPPTPVHALTPSRLVPAKTRLFLDCLAEHLDGITRPRAR